MHAFARLAIGSMSVVAAFAQPVAPIRVDDAGRLLRDGEPYRGIGINYFDAFVRSLRDSADTGYEVGFEVLAEHEIPFARFMACGFWPKDFALYLNDKNGYFRVLDGVVQSAEHHKIGLVPSLFWFVATVPDIVGEPVSAWGDADSATRAFMRGYTDEVVSRYVRSPAIWAWEFGNEYNLAADLPIAGNHYPMVAPRLGTPDTRTAADRLSSAMVRDAFRDFAQTVRARDPVRPITSGHSLPRPAAWHLEHEGTWVQDSYGQFEEQLNARVPAPANLISVHMYPFDRSERFGGTHYEEILGLVVRHARASNRAVFVGEFGAPDDEEHGGPDRARREVLAQLAAIERSHVDLAALWVYDLPQQENTHSVTPDNHRAYLLNALRDANQRLARAGAGHTVDLGVGGSGWSGRLHDNVGNHARQGSGFNPLWHASFPGESLFRPDAVGLNFEHIFDGTASNRDHAMFTPRNDRARIEVHSARSASLHWPAEDSAWGIECTIVYAFRDDHAIDIEFTATPHTKLGDLGYVAFMWASYMNHTRERSIHFYGKSNGHEGWVAFGEETDDGFETGTVACEGVAPLPFEDGAQTLNLIEHPAKTFTLPFYYGLVDGDGDPNTDCDTMAYVMMFDQRETVRFAMWNFIKNSAGEAEPHSPAWDWQYVVRNPHVGERYQLRARLLYIPFTSPEGIREQYLAWASQLSP